MNYQPRPEAFTLGSTLLFHPLRQQEKKRLGMQRHPNLEERAFLLKVLDRYPQSINGFIRPHMMWSVEVVIRALTLRGFVRLSPVGEVTLTPSGKEFAENWKASWAYQELKRKGKVA
jgi:hypothetical protein